MEETGFEVNNPIFLTNEIDHEGDGRRISMFCVIGGIRPADIILQEGVGIGVFTVSELKDLNISPFVRRTIESHVIPMLSGPES
jgi:hypothetical protein